MFCGATFLPPAVTMMSFLRSVIAQEAVVVDARRCRRCAASRRRRAPRASPRLVLVVTGEDRRRRGRGSRRPRRSSRSMPGMAGPTVPNVKLVGAVDVRRRSWSRSGRSPRGSRMSSGVEELGDLLGERRAARDRDAEPAAEPRLDLREDKPVGEAVLQRETARDRLARAGAVRSPARRRAAPSRSAAAWRPLRRRSSPRPRCAPSRARAAPSAGSSGEPPA